MAERDEQRHWERRRAPLAAAGAIAGALLPIAGSVVGGQALADRPKDSASRLLYFDEHAGELTLYAILIGLGALAIALPMYYLYRATRFRRPRLPRAALVTLLGGTALLAAGTIVAQLVLADRAAAFASTGDQTYQEAKRVFELTGLRIVGGAVLAGNLALGFAFVMISLNAMRAGLLTRFMGFLGIIVGALFVLPLAPGPPVVQSFWFAALAALFLGRWPSGIPRAWEEGREIPWPTRQELMEQAQREREGLPATEPEPATAGSAPSPRPRSAGARKRKRKKRR